jgi:hypothetical protein
MDRIENTPNEKNHEHPANPVNRVQTIEISKRHRRFTEMLFTISSAVVNLLSGGWSAGSFPRSPDTSFTDNVQVFDVVSSRLTEAA